MSPAAHVADLLQRYGLQDTTGVVAVSGGPDSVALAHLMIEAMPHSRVVLAHVNHRLRGDESDADEAFVQQLAAKIGTQCKTTRINVAAVAGANRDNLENTARRERY